MRFFCCFYYIVYVQHITWNILILKNYLLFIWNSNITGHLCILSGNPSTTRKQLSTHPRARSVPILQLTCSEDAPRCWSPGLSRTCAFVPTKYSKTHQKLENPDSKSLLILILFHDHHCFFFTTIVLQAVPLNYPSSQITLVLVNTINSFCAEHWQKLGKKSIWINIIWKVFSCWVSTLFLRK